MGMVTLVRAAGVLVDDRVQPDLEVVLDGPLIAEIRPVRPAGVDRVLDLGAATLLPGLVDIHVHGGAGFDSLDPEPAALRGMSVHLAQHGVTSFVPTTVTASRTEIDAAVATVAAVGHDVPGALPRGLHLEGPYVAAAQAGAQPLAWLRDPDPAEYLPWFDSGAVSRITVAPELAGMTELIRAAVARGVHPTIGHTACTGDEALAAIEAGARECTHTFSGMEPLNHRSPNALSTCLADDRVFAEAIVDGVHIHPRLVALLLRIVGPDRLVLVSDAIRATGLGDGRYKLGDQLVTVRDGVTRRDIDGGLAGSVLTLDAAVRNLIRFTGVDMATAVRTATVNPARAMGWDGELGRIAPGLRADLVAVDADLDVRWTAVGGTAVQRHPPNLTS